MLRNEKKKGKEKLEEIKSWFDFQKITDQIKLRDVDK